MTLSLTETLTLSWLCTWCTVTNNNNRFATTKKNKSKIQTKILAAAAARRGTKFSPLMTVKFHHASSVLLRVWSDSAKQKPTQKPPQTATTGTAWNRPSGHRARCPGDWSGVSRGRVQTVLRTVSGLDKQSERNWTTY